MPAPAKTSDEAVLKAARRLLDQEGLEAFSMQVVAAAVGVRAPSLYKRFRDRDGLLSAVADAAAADLRQVIDKANRAPSPVEALRAMAVAYRAFGRRSPTAYRLLYPENPAQGPSIEARTSAVAPVLARLDTLVGSARCLDAARLLTAWLHGFIAMERSGAFKLGGDIDAAFAYGLDALLPLDEGRPESRPAASRRPRAS